MNTSSVCGFCSLVYEQSIDDERACSSIFKNSEIK